MFTFVFSTGVLSAAHAAETQAWNYANEGAWAAIDKNYAVCGNGTQQSPVEIGVTQKEHLPPLFFHYGDARVHLEQIDYTLRVDLDNDLTLIDNEKAYRLIELRFHTPAEHVVLGHFWPLEIELMHRDNLGKMLIVSVFAATGPSNPGMQTLLDHVWDNTWLADITFNPQTLIPPKPDYYSYTGSLTIPPCTEGIEWRILKEPITVSQKQLAALTKITGHNARLPQPAYMRTIRETGQ